MALSREFLGRVERHASVGNVVEGSGWSRKRVLGRMARSVGSEAANNLPLSVVVLGSGLFGFALLGEWGESFLSVDWFPPPRAAPNGER